MSERTTARALRAAPLRSRSEWLWWSVGGLVLAIVLSWPLLAHLGTVVPHDSGDPLTEAWEIAWGGHAILHQPTHIFDSNTFYPAHTSYAFSDSLLGYSPAALVGTSLKAALIRYNLLYLFSFTLLFASVGLLARELGCRVPGAIVAAVAYTYSPIRLEHDGQLNIISVGGIPLALFLLATGLRQGRRRQIWWGWAVAAWQMSIGFSMGIWFGYLLATIAACYLVHWWSTGRPAYERRIVVATVTGGLGFLLVTGLLIAPYAHVQSSYPHAARGYGDLAIYSPPPRGLLATAPENWFWGDAGSYIRDTLIWPPEELLFPGLVIVVLAWWGLRSGALTRRFRAVLVIGGLVTVVLSFGVTVLGGDLYLPLFHALPGWNSIRTPGRFSFIWDGVLAILGGLGAQRVGEVVARCWPTGRIPLRPESLAQVPAVSVLVLGALVLGESFGELHLAPVPPPPAGFEAVKAPLLVLPVDPVNDITYMYWSIDGFPRIANGNSSYVPPTLDRLRNDIKDFPSAASIAILRKDGIRSVVLNTRLAPGSPWSDAGDRPVEGLGITRDDQGDQVVFTLDPSGG